MIYHYFHKFLEMVSAAWQRRDPRVCHMLLQSSPTALLLPLMIYMAMIIYGPRLMRHRQPMRSKQIMAAYNLFQVSLSAYMLYELTANSPRCWTCAPMEVTDSARATRMMNAVLLFHYSKLIDFLDTAFLILKKDFLRMSYLHTFHHASMFFNFWMATLFTPGDPAWMECAMNSFVHCIMYLYYFLAALGPEVRRFLWWKRYLTQLQLLQFGGMLSHLLLMQVPGFRCHVPPWALAISFVYVLVIVCFFVNFYIKCYRRSHSQNQLQAPPQPSPVTAPEAAATHTATEGALCRPPLHKMAAIGDKYASTHWRHLVEQQRSSDEKRH